MSDVACAPVWLDWGMSGIYAAVEIAAPVESVFEKYVQYERHPEWQPGLLRATLVSDGPVARGTRGLEVRRLFGREVSFPYEITEHVAPSRSAFATLEGALQPAGVARFAPVAAGTRMEFEMELRARGPLRVVSGLLVPLFRRQTRQDLERFKVWVQGELSADAPAPGLREASVKRHRAFDPRRVGELECTAWVAYYRRDWLAFLRSAVGLTRHTFGLPWPSTLRGAWLVLRANQLWAPFPVNDPDGARRTMESFYRLIARRYGESFDPARAAALEVEWWRVHREHQHSDAGGDDRALVDALSALYAYAYAVPEASVQPAAEQRALAMHYSDAWVAGGCDLQSPFIAEERAALVRSYAGLLAAVHRL
jgi:uncharacterized protein YndB with AHSA1/START domain